MSASEADSLRVLCSLTRETISSGQCGLSVLPSGSSDEIPCDGGMGGWARFPLVPASKEPSLNMLFQVKPGGQGLTSSPTRPGIGKHLQVFLSALMAALSRSLVLMTLDMVG